MKSEYGECLQWTIGWVGWGGGKGDTFSFNHLICPYLTDKCAQCNCNNIGYTLWTWTVVGFGINVDLYLTTTTELKFRYGKG